MLETWWQFYPSDLSLVAVAGVIDFVSFVCDPSFAVVGWFLRAHLLQTSLSASCFKKQNGVVHSGLMRVVVGLEDTGLGQNSSCVAQRKGGGILFNRQTTQRPDSKASLKILKLPGKAETEHMVNGENGWDLHDGFESFDKKDEDDPKDTRVMQLFTWLAHKDNKALLEETKKATDTPLIVCGEKSLVNMALTVVDQHQDSTGWALVVFKHKGIIFCQSASTAKEKIRREEFERNKKGQLMSYRGHKFAHSITVDHSQITRDLKSVVSNKDQFISLQHIQLGKHNLLVTGSIDAVDEDDKYVEIKCMYSYEKPAADGASRAAAGGDAGSGDATDRKWQAAWLTNKLLNLDRVVVGKYNTKNKGHKVYKIQEMATVDLCSQEEQNAMLSCLDMILDFVSQNVEESNKGEIKYYLMEWGKEKGQVHLLPIKEGEMEELKVVKKNMLDVIA